MKNCTIVLSGCSLKIFGHAGFISAIEDNGYKAKSICGNSGGAILGALYASGKTAKEITNILFNENIEKLVSVNIFSILRLVFTGIFKKDATISSGNRALNLLLKHTEAKKFKDLDVDFKCVATDLENYTYYVLSKETTPDLEIAIAAYCSSTLPFVFPMKEIIFKNKKVLLSDGGFYDDFPTDLAKNGEIVFAHLIESDEPIDITGWNFRALGAIIDNLIRANIKWSTRDAKNRLSCFNMGLSNGFNKPTFEFNVDIDEKKALFDQGYMTAQAIIAKKG